MVGRIGTKQLLKRIIVLLMVLALMFNGTEPMTVKAAEKAVDTIDFKDFSNWRSGLYHWTNGKYCAFDSRICLTDYVTINGGEYRVIVKNSNYRLLIRELDKNKMFIDTYTLANGQTYKPSASTYYLGISIYNAKSEKGITYNTYKQLFDNGFYAGLQRISTSTDADSSFDSSTSQDESSNTAENSTSKMYNMKEISYKDFSNWRTGLYNWTTGNIIRFATRICLNNYVTVAQGEYKVVVKNSNYRLLIRELDKNKTFVNTYTLANDQVYKPGNNAYYLGISIYNAKSENGITFNTYKQLFANGFYAGLEEVVEEKDEVQDDIIIDSSNNSLTSSNSKPATFRDELKQMILTGDMTKHDISKYGLTYRQVDDTWNDLKQNECYVAVKTYGAAFLSVTKNSAGIVQTVYIYNSDADFVNRYNRTCAAIDKFMAGTDSKMTDLDKILYAHEYIVKNTVYAKDSTGIGGCAGGVLGNGKGYCQGYANALILLLHEMNIDSNMVSSSSMNHGWVIVELDGQYYHIDPTWDNTRQETNNTYSHRFLLRNDKELNTIIANGSTHHDWYCSSMPGFTSTSTRFTNWFVHDVAGTMYYYNGMWYYQDISSNSIMCSDVNGNNKIVVVNGDTVSGTVKLSGITSGVLKYTIGGNSYTKKLK